VVRDPSWFLCLPLSGDALCRLGVWRSQSLSLLGGFSCKVYLHCLSKILPLEVCFVLPPSSRHLGISPPFHIPFLKSNLSTLSFPFVVLGCQPEGNVCVHN
jgi:hypothetical protein